jgi:hypothetical protein
MSPTSRRAVTSAVLLALGSQLTGCFGKFVLVKKLYAFNESVSSNKFVQTLIFWVFCLLPIYEFAAIADAVVLNLIEFWTGSNPLAMNEGDTQQRVVEADGQKATLTFADRGRSVRIELTAPGRATRVLQFRGSEAAAEMRDERGQVLVSSRPGAAGGIEVVDGSGNVLAQHGAAEVMALSDTLADSPRALLATLGVAPGAFASAAP